MKKGVIFLVIVAMFALGGCFGSKDDSKQEEKISKRGIELPVIYFRGTPNSWGKTEMKMVSENIWQTVVDFTKGDENGGPRFKVTEGEDWTKTYPVKDYLITKGYGKYRVEFNYVTKAVTAKKVNESGIAYNHENVYLRGTNNVWDKTEMSLVSDNKWEITAVFNEGDAKGGPRFKIDVTGDWKESYPVSDYLLTRGAGKYKIVFNDESKKIEVFKFDKNGFYSKYENVYLRGTNNSWDKTEMSLISDNKWEIKAVFNEGDAKGGPRFKIDVTGDWKESYPAADFVVEKAMYNIVFDEITKSITIEKIEEVKFTDEKIENAVREKLGKLAGIITKDDINKITELSLANTGVTSLGELIKLTQLKTLDLSGNSISDITVLGELSQLKTVNLKNNKLRTDSLPMIVKLRNKGILVEDNTNYVNTVEDIKAMAKAGVDFDIHSIAIYEGRTIEVKISETKKPVVVILSALEEVNWKVNIEKGVTLIKVITAGIGNSTVTGIANGDCLHMQNVGTRVTCYYATNYFEYLKEVDKINDTFGKKPKTFQSVVKCKEFIIDGETTTDYQYNQDSKDNVKKVLLNDKYLYFLKKGINLEYPIMEDEKINKLKVANAGIGKGKWYGEFKLKTRIGKVNPGCWTSVGLVVDNQNDFWYPDNKLYGINIIDKWKKDVIASSELKDGDRVGIALDFDEGRVFYSINGNWKINPLNYTKGLEISGKNLKYYFAISETSEGKQYNSNDDSWTAAFDRADLKYTIPEGYKPYGEIIN